MVCIQKFNIQPLIILLVLLLGIGLPNISLAMDDYPIGGATGVYSLWLAGLRHQVNDDSGS